MRVLVRSGDYTDRAELYAVLVGDYHERAAKPKNAEIVATVPKEETRR
jgi:hypothetical protein